MERWIVKLIVMNIIFIVVFVVTLLPLKVATYFRHQGKRGKIIISHMMCFGGGVFFAMYMLQMTPASLDIVREYLVEAYDINYPLAEFVIGCGFLLMILSEVSLSWLGKNRNGKSNQRTAPRTTPDKDLVLYTDQTQYDGLEDIIVDAGQTNRSSTHNTMFTSEIDDEETSDANQRPNSFPKPLNKDYPDNSRNGDGSSKFPVVPLMSFSSNEGTAPLLSSPSSTHPLLLPGGPKTMHPLISIGIKAGLAPLLSISFNTYLDRQFSILSDVNSDYLNSPTSDGNHAELAEHTTEHVHASRSLVLLFALSLHHVFEGLSIGLKHSTIAVWHMCIAIVSHEIIVAFSLGLQLVHTFESTPKIILASFICSVMSPLGIAAGMAIIETGGQDNEAVQIANGLLQSLATGIFIYVTFFEILQDELGHNKGSFIKIMWICIGFLSLSSLGVLTTSGDDNDTEDIGTNFTDIVYNVTEALTRS